MATLKQLRQRIRAAKSIQQITRAMKLVAAARLKKATDRALQARPYSEKLRDVMLSISESGELPAHPLLEKRVGDNYCLLLITGERGLCGSYNTNVIRKAADFLASTPGNPTIFAVGKKGMQFFSKRGYKIAHHYTLPSAGVSYDDALKVARIARELFETNQVQRLYLCYSQFYSPIRQVPRVIQLLPIEPPVADTGPETAAPHAELSFSFEPKATSLLEELLPRYFLTLVHQGLLEGTASFFGAQMTAMTNATDNAGKMISDLTLKANRERQTAITTEILEVVGGAEALKG